MKHTLKAKYAADGLNAHRQRVLATQPEAARRQKIVDQVTARFEESSRTVHDRFDTVIAGYMLDRTSRRSTALRDSRFDAIRDAWGTWNAIEVDVLSKRAPVPLVFNVIRS